MTGGTYGQTLRRPGVQSFLWTQFLGAFNDNVCKLVVTFLTIAHFVSAAAPESGATSAAATGGALVGAIFILPFLLFSGYAGHFADAMSKRRVLIAMKWLEIVAMVLMIPALMAAARGVIWPMLAVLFLMAVQATLFSPAKYGIVPEALPAEDLSRANGLLEMTTFVAIVLGTVVGGELFEIWRGEPWKTGGLLVAIAVVGTVTSYGIPHTPAAKPGARFSLNPAGEVWLGTRRLLQDRNLLMTVVGISFFWFVGALIQIAALPFGLEELRVGEAASTRLFTALAIGIGLGSLVAGRLSGDKIELGLVPIGAFGMGVCSLALLAVTPSYGWSAVALLLMGFAGGWFAVPLNALLQQKPDDREKGRILATNNVANTIGILLASAVGVRARRPLGSARQPDHWPHRRGHPHRDDLPVIHPAGLFRAIRAVDGDAHGVSHQDRRPPEHSNQGPGAHHLEPRVDDRWRAGRRVRPAIRQVPGVRPALQEAGHSLAAAPVPRDSSHGRQQDGSRARARARPRGAHRGPRGLHLRRRRSEPHGQPATVEARLREDRRRPRRAGDSGLPGSRLGQRLQLQARPLLLEAAGAAAVPGDGGIRQAACHRVSPRRKRIWR